MSGRDISEMVNSYHRQQAGIRQLQQGTESIQQYISNIKASSSISPTSTTP